MRRPIARLKHDRAHAVTTYIPLSTFAWRADKVSFTPRPAAFWHQMQELGLKK